MLEDVQTLSAKGVVYRPLAENFLTLKLAVAWRQAETSAAVLEFIKILKTTALALSTRRRNKMS